MLRDSARRQARYFALHEYDIDFTWHYTLLALLELDINESPRYRRRASPVILPTRNLRRRSHVFTYTTPLNIKLLRNGRFLPRVQFGQPRAITAGSSCNFYIIKSATDVKAILT